MITSPPNENLPTGWSAGITEQKSSPEIKEANSYRWTNVVLFFPIHQKSINLHQQEERHFQYPQDQSLHSQHSSVSPAIHLGQEDYDEKSAHDRVNHLNDSGTRKATGDLPVCWKKRTVLVLEVGAVRIVRGHCYHTR